MSPASPSGSGAKGKGASKAKGPAWKGSRSTAAPQRPAAAGSPTWQQQQAASQQLPLARWLAAGIAVLVIGVFLYVFFFPPRATPLVVFTAEAYPLRLPPLSFAQEDALLLERIAPQNLRKMRERVPLEEKARAIEGFKLALDAAGQGPLRLLTWRRQAVVVYVAAHGAISDRGPCLIPQNADPYNSQEWLELKEVLAVLKSAKGLSGKRKLLVLDCQRVLSCWRAGLLDNHFTEALLPAVQEANDPDLYVLTAAGEGQIAWAAPELRGSVFSHFLARGLRGEANSQDDTVSLAQLVRYVSAQVDGYVQQRRAARQQPQLLHASGLLTLDAQGRLTSATSSSDKQHDVPLVYVDDSRRDADLKTLQRDYAPLAEARKLAPRAAAMASFATAPVPGKLTLGDLWQMYDRCRAGEDSADGKSLPARVVDPVGWASVQQRLAAIQERLLAGAAYQRRLPILINDLGRDLAPEVWAPAGKRLPLNLIGGVPRPTSSRQDAPVPTDNFFEAYLKEQDPAKKNELARRPVARTKLVSDIYALFTRAGRQLTASDWQAAQQLLAVNPPGPEGELIEGQLLTLLEKGLRPSPSSFLAAPLVSRALAARQAAEVAATPIDTRVHYAFERLLHEADEQRRDAEDKLFLGDRWQQQAASAWKAAVDGDGQTTGYIAVAEIGARLSEAFGLRDEVWSELPLLAEWHFLRRKLTPAIDDGGAASSPANDPLVELIEQSVALDWQLKRVANSRDGGGDFSKLYKDDCQKAVDKLRATWTAVRGGLDEIAEPLSTRESRYQAKDIREVEFVMRTPLLSADVLRTVFDTTLTTLEGWEAQEIPSLRPELATDQTAAAAWQSPQRPFLEQFHRLLKYEFNTEYEQHRLSDAWKEGASIDGVFRATAAAEGTAGGDISTWSRLGGLLNAFDKDMQSAKSPAWDDTRSALEASDKLRAWDRKVRVAAPWLCCFKDDLKSPRQVTPAAWLQKFDAAHLIAWHASRAATDYWGSGDEAQTAGPPFFAVAARRCDDVLRSLGAEYSPLRYDWPGSGAARPLAAVQDSALAALQDWRPLKLESPFSMPTAESPSSALELAVQPSTEQPPAMPRGTATLSLPAAATASGVRFAFDQEGKQTLRDVEITEDRRESMPVAAFALRSGAAAGAAADPNTRLWYRGHVRSLLLDAGPLGEYVTTSYVRQNYTTPTVEVRGADALRGSVLFIFDCSASMLAADDRFKNATAELQTLLRELAGDSSEELRLGLWAYGMQTPTRNPNYYEYERRHDDFPNNLAPAGRDMLARMMGNSRAFREKYPHPDRDLRKVVSLGRGNANAVLAELAQFRVEQCLGSTPLYYSIQHALETAFQDDADTRKGLRQIVVISDGVNMPYNIRTGLQMGPVGRVVNREDEALLVNALKQHPDVRVTVLLFGGRSENVEKEQFDKLLQIERDYPTKFDVRELASAKDIYRSIRESFPKTAIELANAAGNSSSQSLVLNKATPVSEGPQGVQRTRPDRRELRITAAGEAKPSLTTTLSLVGGEKVVVQYNSQSSQPTLEFLSDTRRDREPLTTAIRKGQAQPALVLRVAALDPDSRDARNTLFFLRLRTDSSQQFTPRPIYTWVEVEPLDAPRGEPIIPVFDAGWEDTTELPVLQIPVRAWPAQATAAKVRAWFRYTDPPFAQAELRRGRSVPTFAPLPGIAAPSGQWSVDDAGGEEGKERRVTVTCKLAGGDRQYENLLKQGVWLMPPADRVTRRFAKDGSQAIHEFGYTRPNTSTEPLNLRVGSRQQFEQESYYAELKVDVN